MYKVMLVDDEKKILDGLSAMINWAHYGFAVCARARNGAEALEAAKQWNPDLIVTDIRMGQMDGLEMIRVWKAISPRTQFIILSGYSEFGYAKQAMQLEVKHYVLKPIEETELEACLAKVAEEIRSSREEATELTTLRRQAQSYLRLQRENMLRDWIYAGPHAEDIMANLTELDVRFPYPRCGSMAIRKDKPPLAWGDAEIKLVVELLTAALPSPSVVYPFRFEEGELGLMFSFESAGSEDHEGRTRECFLRLFSKQFSFAFRLETGPWASSSAELSESYRAAHAAIRREDAQADIKEEPLLPHYPRSIVDEIKAYIDAHYNEQLTLANVSERFFIHGHYLSQLFRKKTGVTFLHYLTAVRMAQAKQLLLATDLKVYEISSLVGYDDSKYFSKIFERTAGMKPSEYKHSHRKTTD